MTPDPLREAALARARQARTVAIVIAATIALWMLAQLVGAEYGWDPRLAFVFDAAALAAFLWAMFRTWHIWQRGRGRDK